MMEFFSGVAKKHFTKETRNAYPEFLDNLSIQAAKAGHYDLSKKLNEKANQIDTAQSMLGESNTMLFFKVYVV